MSTVPAFVLAVNLVFLFLVSSTSGRVISALGCAVALSLWLVPAASAGARARLARHVPLSLPVGSAWIPLVIAFGVPLVLMAIARVTGFQPLDGRVFVLLGWLAAIGFFAGRPASERQAADSESPSESARAAPTPSPLVIAFVVCAALFWLGIVWDLGVNRVVVEDSRPKRLTTNFELWESEPAREHLFLAYLGREQYERREAYTNHLQPYLFAMYGSAKLAQALTGRPLWVGVNLTPFAMAALGVFAFAFMAMRTGNLRAGGDLKFFVILWLALGFFVTEWHYWLDLYAYNADNLFPIVVYLVAVLWASARPRLEAVPRGPLLAAAIAVGAFGWIYWPLAVAALWIYWGQALPTLKETFAKNRALVTALTACSVTGVLVYGLPRLLVALNGYTTSDSAFAFRSGLSGDTAYFENIAQAVFRPACCAERGLWDLLFPAFVPLLIYAVWAARRPSEAERVFPPYVFLAAPYVFSLVFVPQSVSIHPYLYDQLLFLPAALIGAQCALSPDVRQRLHGPWLLAFLLLAALLIMTNLIGIAQGMRSILPI